jgi:hypothetical protein
MPRLALALALATAALASPRPADACGNTVRRVVDSTNHAVRNAEQLLAQGDSKKAISAIRDAFGDRAVTAPTDDDSLHERAQRVLALAVVRSKGELAVGAELGGKTDARRQAAVAWAVLALRLQRPIPDENPLHASDLAEALALQASGRAEAYGLLKDLADRDLMPGAHGWALLAELGRERGDLELGKKAVERCQQIVASGVQCDTTENT